MTKSNDCWQLIPLAEDLPVFDLVADDASSLGKSTLILGRDTAVDLVLDHPKISRHHASLTINANTIEVRDLESANGISVNGEQVEKARLFPGDELSFYKLRYRLKSPHGETVMMEACRESTVSMPRCSAVLECDADGFEGKVFPLAGERLILGRDKRCDIVLDDPSISFKHAVFSYRNQHWYLSDAGSTNGSLVNGVTAEKTVLEDGDELSFAGLPMTFKLMEQPPGFLKRESQSGGLSGSSAELIDSQEPPPTYNKRLIAGLCAVGLLIVAALFFIWPRLGLMRSDSSALLHQPIKLSSNWPSVKLQSRREIASQILIDVNADYLLDIITLDKAGTVTAISGGDAKQLFVTELASGRGVALVPISSSDGRRFVAVAHEGIALLDSSGQLQWQSTIELGDINFQPMAADVNGDGFPDVVLASETIGFAALNSKEQGVLLWQSPLRDGGHFAAAPLQIPAGNNATASFVVNSDRGQIKALDVVDSKPVVRWVQQLSPIVAGAAPTYVDGPTGLVALHTSQRQLVALDVSSGVLRWQLAMQALSYVSPLAARLNNDFQQDIVAVSLAGQVLAIDGANGELLWQRNLNAECQSSPALYDLNGDDIVDILLIDITGSLHIIDGASGELLKQTLVTSGESYAHSILLAENTADGLLDLILLSQSGLLNSFSINRSAGRGSDVWTMNLGNNYHGTEN